MLKIAEYADNRDDAIFMSVVSARKSSGLDIFYPSGDERKRTEVSRNDFVQIDFCEVLGTSTNQLNSEDGQSRCYLNFVRRPFVFHRLSHDCRYSLTTERCSGHARNVSLLTQPSRLYF